MSISFQKFFRSRNAFMIAIVLSLIEMKCSLGIIFNINDDN